MKRFILTGAPGSGKTSLLGVLAQQGYPVVAEAATDVIASEQAAGIAEPWRDPRFISKIAQLQAHRQQQAVAPGALAQIFDRSPVCTLALARYLGHPVPARLSAEIERIAGHQVYDRRVFFIRPLGFLEPTAARRISYQDSLVFERVHEREYARLGFELVDVPAGDVAGRAATVSACLRAWAGPPQNAGGSE
ncbi:MAG: AAA family ATPase [Nocardiopsaceae bacterium]|nr:AAA family ATPase [Nocardiopsaceae bacterium]